MFLLLHVNQHGKQSKSSQPDMTAPLSGVYSCCEQHNAQYIMVQAPKACTSSMSNNVYNSASRSSNSSLGGSVPGFQSTVGLTKYSSMQTIPGIPDENIWQGLQSEYVCLDEFLQNYTVNNT